MGLQSLRDFLQNAKQRITLVGEPDIEEEDIEAIQDADWERMLERFTEDMDPWAIDIVKLADRYQNYIERLEEFDLEVPGRIIVVGAVLLRMKAEVLREMYEEGETDEAMVEEELPEEFDEMVDEMEELEDVEEEQLRIPEAVPEPPVKKKAKRKVTLDELKDALEDAVALEEQREERQEERKEAEDYGIEVEEDDITNKLEQLYGRLQEAISTGDDAVTFSDLAAEKDRQEQINEFVHVMHLETENRVRCMQEEWLGELEIEVLDEENN